MFSSSAFAKKVEKLPVERGGLHYEYFSTNIANGQYEVYHRGYPKYRFTYKDGKREGLFKVYHENGQLKKKTTWKDGELDGIAEEYNEKGQKIRQGSYKNGKKHGGFVEGYDWDLMVGYYKDGQREGQWESYSEDGRLKRKCYYVNGKKYECE